MGLEYLMGVAIWMFVGYLAGRGAKAIIEQESDETFRSGE